MTKPSAEAQQELNTLRHRVLLVLQFIDNAEDLGDFAKQMRVVTERAFKRGDVKGLRGVARDLEAASLALPKHEREGLEAMLKAHIGVNMEEERLQASDRVGVILGRGTISSETERKYLENHLEMLEATDGDPSEAAAVRRLLENVRG